MSLGENTALGGLMSSMYAKARLHQLTLAM